MNGVTFINYSLLAPQLFTVIPQSPVSGTQALTYVEICPLGRSSSDSFNFLFFSHDMLIILPTQKLNDGSVILFIQMMTCLDCFPSYPNNNMLKHLTNCWLMLFFLD